MVGNSAIIAVKALDGVNEPEAGQRTRGNNALNVKLRSGIQESSAAHVNYEAVMVKKVSLQDGVTHINYHKYLSECTT